MKSALTAGWQSAPLHLAPPLLREFAARYPDHRFFYHTASLGPSEGLTSYAHVIASDRGGCAVTWSGAGQRQGTIITSNKGLEAVKRMIERGDICSAPSFKSMKPHRASRQQRRAPRTKALAAFAQAPALLPPPTS